MTHVPPVHSRSLTSILVEAGVVTPEQVDEGLVRQRSNGLRIGESLVEMGAVTEEDIGWALARQLALPFMDPSPDALDRDLIRSFPDGLLHRLDALPLVNEEVTLAVALADPTDVEIVGELERAAGRPLTLAVATPTAIRAVLREVLGPRRDLRAALPDPAADARVDVRWDRSGVSFLLFHLEEARRAGATEIHFLPRQGTLEVCHRVGRRLLPVRKEAPGAIFYLLTRIEALGGPVIDDHVLHVGGRASCPYGIDELDLGVSLLHQEHGIAVTIELPPAAARPSALDELGLDPQDLARLRAELAAPAGLGLVIGPPRAGGSTTLACLLAEIGLGARRVLAFGSDHHGLADVRVAARTAEAAEGWAGAVTSQSADVAVLDGILAGDRIDAVLSPAASGRWLLARTDWTDTFALLEHLARRPNERAALADRLRFVVHQRLVSVTAPEGPGAASRRVFEVLVPGDALRDALRAAPAARDLEGHALADGHVRLAGRLDTLVAAGLVDPAQRDRTLS